MPEFRVRLDGLAEARAAFGKLGSPASLQKAVAETVLAVHARAVHAAPVDTGALRSSLRMKVGALSGEVWTDSPYGAHVEFGTAAHVITPTSKRALWWPGAAHPVRMVHHPGTRPQPFLLPAAEAERMPFRARLAAGITGAARAAAR